MSQAETAARGIQTALSNAMSGGATGGAGGAGGSATLGPIIPNGALSSLVNMREQVTLTRQQLVDFATKEAKAFGLSIGQNVVNPANVATGDLKDFYERVNDVKVKVEEVNPKLDLMGQLFAFTMLKDASAAVKDFGMSLAKVLNEGITRAADAQTIGVDLKNALSINKDGSLLDENNVVSVDKLNGVMGKLNKTAQDIGLSTMFSDTDILKVMEHLSANGIDAQTILNGGAKSVAYLAQATKSELTPTVETITSIMHGMGKTLQKDFAGDSNKALMSVSDTLTNIKLTTGESLQQIGNTMKYVGPIADELHIPFKDLAVSVDILARSGIRGSQAGTALRRMFTNLTPTSDKAAEAMKDLGIITADGTNRFYDQTGKMKSLTEIQGIMYESMKDLNDEQKIYALRTIFGQYAMQSMAKIASTTPEEFAILADKINQSGTAMRMGEEQMNTYNGQMDVMNENIGIAKKQLGDALLPILTPIITKLGELFAWFSNLSPGVKQFIAVFAGLVSAFAIVTGVIGGAVAGFALLNISLALAGTSLAAIAAPVAIVIAVVAALIAIGILLWQNWDTVKAKAGEIWTAVSTSVSTFFNSVIAWFTELPAKSMAGLAAFGTWLTTNVGSAWTGIATWLTSTWTAISSWFTSLPAKLAYAIGFVGGWFSTTISNSWTAFTKWLGETWTAISTWFTNLPMSLTDSLGYVAGWLYKAIKHGWTAFTKWTDETWTAISTWFTSLPTKFATAINTVATWLATNVPKAWTAFTTWLSDTWKAIAKWFVDLPAKMLTAITTFATWLTTNVALAWTAYSTWLTSVWTAISTWFTELPAKMLAVIQTFATWFTGAVASNWTAFTTWLGSTWSSISTWFVELPGKMMTTLSSLIAQIVSVGKSIGTAIWDGIKSILSGIGDYVVGLVRGAIDGAKRMWESFKGGFNRGAAEDGGSSPDIVPHAAGGIFTGPTLLGNQLFGEAGPEAVVPLNRWNMMASGFDMPRGGRDVDMGAGGGGSKTVNVYMTNHFNGHDNQRDSDYVVNQIRRTVAMG